MEVLEIHSPWSLSTPVDKNGQTITTLVSSNN